MLRKADIYEERCTGPEEQRQIQLTSNLRSAHNTVAAQIYIHVLIDWREKPYDKSGLNKNNIYPSLFSCLFVGAIIALKPV